MAFVPPTTTKSFLGSQSLTTTSTCPLHARPAAPLVRMAFSSIDMPEQAVKRWDSSLETKDAILNACYKQVFGNAYLMEEERAALATFESDFKMGNLDVRELVRAMAKSEAYRKRFFARSGPFRFIELNLKHFLGRGPDSFDEITYHVKLLQEHGYEAEIDSYLDSQEYEENFGGDVVPRFIFKGMYPKNDDFNRLTIMRKFWDGCSTSTVSGSTAPGKPIPSQLMMARNGYVNGFVGVMKGLPAGFRPEPEREKALPPVPANAQAGIRVRIKIAENLYQVYEVPPQMPRDEPAWKKELMGEKKWNGVWY